MFPFRKVARCWGTGESLTHDRDMLDLMFSLGLN